MKLSKVSMIAGFIIAFTLIFELAAHADEANQLTKISFSEAVQVPGKVLPAGNYEFVVARSDSSRNLVQIFNAEGTELYATVQTIPIERARQTDGTSITLAHAPDGKPDAVPTSFYPRTDTGHQFRSSQQEEAELHQAATQPSEGSHAIIT